MYDVAPFASDTAPFVVFYERVISPLHARSTELSRYLFSVRSSWASHHVHKNCARRCTPSMGVCYIDSNGEKPRLWLCLPRQSQEAESNEACTRDIGSTAKALCTFPTHACAHTHTRTNLHFVRPRHVHKTYTHMYNCKHILVG